MEIISSGGGGDVGGEEFYGICELDFCRQIFLMF